MSDEIIGRAPCRSCVDLKLFFGIGGSIMMGNKKPGPEWARFLFFNWMVYSAGVPSVPSAVSSARGTRAASPSAVGLRQAFTPLNIDCVRLF